MAMKPILKITLWRNPLDRLRRGGEPFVWLFFSAIFLLAQLHARPRRLTFEQISIEQGLSQSIVYSILQDQKGFLWFGTEDGLNKYDGYSFTILRRDPHESNSLSYNEIRAMYEDSSGVLWIGMFFGGVIEERNSAGEMYGDVSLKALLEWMTTSLLSAKEIKEGIIAGVKRFSGLTTQDDDMAVSVAKVA